MTQDADATATATYIDDGVIEEISLFKCCRACMRTDNSLTSIDAFDEDSLSYRDKLVFCVLEIEWSKDGLSTLICQQCVSKLRIAYNFRKICFLTNDTLKHYLLLQDEEFSNDKSEYSTTERVDNCELENSKLLKTSIEHAENENHTDCSVEKLSHFEKKSKEDIDVASDLALSANSCSHSHSAIDFLHESIAEESDFANSPTEHTDVLEKQFLSEGIECDLKYREEFQTQIEHFDDSLAVDNDALQNIENQTANLHIETTAAATVAQKSCVKSNVVEPPSFKLENSFQSKGEIDRQRHKCDQCDKSYFKRANLKVHQRTHTGEKPHECQYCDKRFSIMSHLKEHIRRHTGEKPFQCGVCNKRFTVRGELNMHIKSHTGEKKFPCTMCNRRCLTSSDLKLHLRTHTGERPYHCVVCGKQFASTYALSCHTRVHTGERPHTCKICDKSFTQSSHLKVHLKKHTGEKIVCKKCPEEFSHPSQLSAHNRKTHEDENMGRLAHKCLVCEKKFNYPGELDAHMKKHLGEKYSCVICSKEFSSPKYLNEHSRIHSGKSLLNCTMCDKSFTRNQYLVKHLRIHTGEKPYDCDTCGKCFTQQSSLKIHIRAHTGERPYPCTYCSRRFKTSSDLKSHVKTHYRDNPMW